MAPSHIINWFLLLFFYYIIYSALVAAKKVQLDDIIGTIVEKEEEPEGEVLGEDSTGN